MDYNASIYNDTYTLLEQLQTIKNLLKSIEDVDLSAIAQELARTLKTPIQRPTSTKLVAVDTANSQEMVGIGDGLAIENGTLNAVNHLLVHASIDSGDVIPSWTDVNLAEQYIDGGYVILKSPTSGEERTIYFHTSGSYSAYIKEWNDDGELIYENSHSVRGGYNHTLNDDTVSLSIRVEK